MNFRLIKGMFLPFLGIVLLTQCALQKTAKFDFETGTQGWLSQNWQDFRGSYGVEQTSENSISGSYALVLDCNSNSKGEAYVDLRKEFKSPQNLDGKTIKCWVLIPSTQDNDILQQIGVQLFVKSVKNENTANEQWFSEYSTINDLSGLTGSWYKITLKPGIETKKGYVEQGFDPKNIAVIGIKIASEKGSPSDFKGKLFIDGIDW